MELREKLKLLEKERDEALNKLKSKGSIGEIDERELALDVREYAVDNSKKYPLIVATGAHKLIVDSIKKQAAKNGRMPDMDVIFDTIESEIEEYELKKAERLKGTPLYEKLYGNRTDPTLEEKPKTKTVEQPKKTKKPDEERKEMVNKRLSDRKPYEKPDKVVSSEEAHRLAYEAYLESKRKVV